ncbi:MULTISPECIES: hypothetical protein [Anaeromyxobacter]|uniref:hypothetical protein n=1 Tax=Anaeromyxobacter TaxID=161492 RepID=UPI001F55DD17|nr:MULTISPECIES: hypothetical protein [unclassified Anaeromyxobacter]
MTRAVALLVSLLLAACATAPRSEARRCEGAADRVSALLRAGLETYVDGMRRFAAARDPELSTAEAEERAKASSDAWAGAHREGLARACREWPEERYRCVMSAADAAALNGCGLEEVVRGYTDEVVSDFATRPFDRSGAGRSR